MAVVEWTTPYKRKRRGLCSSYLAGLIPPHPDSSRPVGAPAAPSTQDSKTASADLTAEVSSLPMTQDSVRGHDNQVAVWVEHGSALRLPQDPLTPLILIGPGTGVAPFRAFLEERAFQLAVSSPSGRECGMVSPETESHPSGPSARPAECALFIGCRSLKADCFYLQQWREMQRDGMLLGGPHGLCIAASRDQPEKVSRYFI